MLSRRIVSLVPSLTETICELGLRDELVGCTSFCIDPPGLHRSAEIIGGTKDPDLDIIKKLNPTHILVNLEENKPEHIRRCEEISDTYTCIPKSPEDTPVMFREIGEFLKVEDRSEEYALEVENLLAKMKNSSLLNRGGLFSKRFLYFIWRDPYMLASSDTYISRMLELVGFKNVAPTSERYPSVDIEDMKSASPEVLFFSSEPYPFRKRDAKRIRSEWPDAPGIIKLDGQLLSWYGTKTVSALKQLDSWVSGQRQDLVEWED